MKTKPPLLVILVIVVIVSACNGNGRDITPTPQALYVVRVEDEVTNKGIYNAKVIVEAISIGKISGVSDIDGYARLFIPADYAGKPGRLIVEAEGYRAYRSEINLYVNQLPTRVLLQTSHTLTDIPSPFETPTAPSTSSAIPTLTGSDIRQLTFFSSRTGDDEIYLMNADGSNLTRLTNSSGHDKFPVWSPDGKWIAFASVRDGDWDIWLMDASGNQVDNITNDGAEKYPSSWSPDGQWILYYSMETGNSDIFVTRRDGTDVRKLTNDPAEDGCADWSPIGDKILFHSTHSGNRKIYVMNTDGSNLQLLLPEVISFRGCPRFSPDGQRIAYESQGNIFISDINGVGIVQLTKDSGCNSLPFWSPDGKMISFTSDQFGDNEIFVMQVDGSRQTRLTYSFGNDDWAGWQPLYQIRPVVNYSSPLLKNNFLRAERFASSLLASLYLSLR